MPEGKSKKKKPASRKAMKKAAAKKTRKKAAGKKGAKKKAAKKIAGKKSGAKAVRKRAVRRKPAAVPEKAFAVEPGPPSGSVPPVEEPASHEEAVGTVTHYYSHLGVAVVQLNTGALKTGDRVRIKGASTDFTQNVESMEYEHRHVDLASAGQSIGLLVKEHAREHDIVYLMK
jgi:histone H1/5